MTGPHPPGHPRAAGSSPGRQSNGVRSDQLHHRQNQPDDDFFADPELVTSPGHGAVAVFQAPQPVRPRGNGLAARRRAADDDLDIDSPFLDLFGGTPAPPWPRPSSRVPSRAPPAMLLRLRMTRLAPGRSPRPEAATPRPPDRASDADLLPSLRRPQPASSRRRAAAARDRRSVGSTTSSSCRSESWSGRPPRPLRQPDADVTDADLRSATSTALRRAGDEAGPGGCAVRRRPQAPTSGSDAAPGGADIRRRRRPTAPASGSPASDGPASRTPAA